MPGGYQHTGSDSPALRPVDATGLQHNIRLTLQKPDSCTWNSSLSSPAMTDAAISGSDDCQLLTWLCIAQPISSHCAPESLAYLGTWCPTGNSQSQRQPGSNREQPITEAAWAQTGVLKQYRYFRGRLFIQG
ncbi:hypothetical protein NQZ68_022771 [Dissostichus eleginoides]|nr:hypothetical protein NQZ68_022771 [Dissostichus eleginoides]